MAIGAYLVAAQAAVNIAGNVVASQAARASARFQGRVAERNAEQQALLFERDAVLADLEAQHEAANLAFDLDTQRSVFARGFATTRALIGASGTEFSGSNLLVAIDQAREAEIAMDVIRLASERRQLGLEDEANMARFGAEQVLTQGEFAQDQATATRRNIQRALPLTLAGSALSGAGNLLQATQAARLTRQPRGRRQTSGAQQPRGLGGGTGGPQ